MIVTKLFFFFTVVLVTSSTKVIPTRIMQIWVDLVAQYNDECMIESKVDKEDIATAYSGHSVSDSEPMGCYLKCLYMKLGMMKPNGDVDAKTITSTASYMTLKLSKRCARESLSKMDLCQKASLLGRCIFKHYLA